MQPEDASASFGLVEVVISAVIGLASAFGISAFVQQRLQSVGKRFDQKIAQEHADSKDYRLALLDRIADLTEAQARSETEARTRYEHQAARIETLVERERETLKALAEVNARAALLEQQNTTLIERNAALERQIAALQAQLNSYTRLIQLQQGGER